LPAKNFCCGAQACISQKIKLLLRYSSSLTKRGDTDVPSFHSDMNEKEHISSLTEAFLADEPAVFLVDVLLGGSAKNRKVQVLIDGDQGVTIEQCAALSRHLSATLDEQEVFSDAWNLEVSSPGVDMPLRWPRQYAKHIGRRLQIVGADDKELIGRLEEVSETGIRLLAEKKEKKKVLTEEITVPFENIKKTIVLVSFN
jgi:ribosome maturation factor RimP